MVNPHEKPSFGEYFLELFPGIMAKQIQDDPFRKDPLVLEGVFNQRFQGTILLMVFDLHTLKSCEI